ncbi:DNA cytosine methyltransferase [Kitasatospora purpeofusca]|uniref:DNA cytosine methyltransferase n=1 Tax=Kitasatospora purpeofusca TaxID=67352 RepID=UPI0035DC8CBD
MAGDPLWFPQLRQTGPWSHRELVALAHPWPVSWLYPPRRSDPPRIVNLFAGAGGWEVGLRILARGGTPFDTVGVELDENAAATARAAGFRRIVADVRHLDPTHPALRYVEGLIVSAPCVTWSPAGLRQGHAHENLELLLDVLPLALEATFGHWHEDGECEAGDSCRICTDPVWDGNCGWTGPLVTRNDAREPISRMTDPGIGLVAESVLWALSLSACYDKLRWLAMEQSGALPSIVPDMIAEVLEMADWRDCAHWKLDAAEIGLASHRRRTYLVAGRHDTVSRRTAQPVDPTPARTAAQALGWHKGVRVNTRGSRATPGGNEWSADEPATAVTGRSRSWYWAGNPQRRITTGEASLLVGMPADHPWAGSDTARFRQIGDVVAPTEAARVLGTLLDRPWREAVRDYLENLYGPQSQARAASANPRLVSRRAAAASAAPVLPGLDALDAPAEFPPAAAERRRPQRSR